MSAPASPRKVAAAPDARPERPARVVVELTEADIPDVIERLPKPDKAAHEAEIAKIDAEIKKLQARTVRHPSILLPCCALHCTALHCTLCVCAVPVACFPPSFVHVLTL